ncbi:MAG: bifunctional demethylmenaquinone methyltransferase/2-methoxy-6-polyprenyl-1,4-benzoquinol methylase UbiE [Planctomycetota bacterium]|nr:bifunctional demethylmenaquinone methyltransferase/2-methoxy-6-polyprenyl-1,4-benzoquinol methylase UbiE [Planctomycetota bacterium]
MAVDKSGERVRRMFGEISPKYDFCNHFLSGGVDYYWRWRTVRTVRADGPAPILDVCTGTGDLALAYWKRSGDARVVGADFTHEMLAIANTKLAGKRVKCGKQLPNFVEADTLKLPFPSDAFQIVSVAFGLRNVSDTSGGLAEMARVCRPGGHVVVLEFSLPSNRILRGLYVWYFKHILPRIGQLFARNQESAYNYLPDSVSEFPAGRELADMMERQGLVDARWKPLTFGIATLYWARKPTD